MDSRLQTVHIFSYALNHTIFDSTFSSTESPDALEEVRKRLELERTRVIKQLETLATREKGQ